MARNVGPFEQTFDGNSQVMQVAIAQFPRMTEPEHNDFGTTVLYVLFSLVVATAIAGIMAYSHLLH